MVEAVTIKQLVEQGVIVITVGGGGIPVYLERGRHLEGVDAVIDKDLASARLAEEVGVDIFVIATDVAGVALNYGMPEQRFLRQLNSKDARQFTAAGHFPTGSMRPKVEAALQFIRNGGKRAVITSIEAIDSAVIGEAGTEIKR